MDEDRRGLLNHNNVYINLIMILDTLMRITIHTKRYFKKRFAILDFLHMFSTLINEEVSYFHFFSNYKSNNYLTSVVIALSGVSVFL